VGGCGWGVGSGVSKFDQLSPHSSRNIHGYMDPFIIVNNCIYNLRKLQHSYTDIINIYEPNEWFKKCPKWHECVWC
jgi:hypothetical protein